MDQLKNLARFFKRPWGVAVLLGIILILIILFSSGNKSGAQLPIRVSYQTINQNITVTGKATPLEKVDLAFERGGTVNEILANVGDRVAEGAPLVRLDTREARAQLDEALARVANHEAILRELERGTRPEELAVQEATVARAETSLKDAQQKAFNEVSNAYTTADDAVHNKADRFFSNPRSNNPQVVLTLNNPQAKTDLETKRASLEQLFSSWQMEIASLDSASDVVATLDSAKVQVAAIASFLDQAATAINGAIGGSNVSQTTLDSWRADVASARSAITISLNTLSSTEEKLRSAETTLTIEKNRLLLALAGSAPEKIEAEAARVLEARSQANLIRAQLAKMTLVAPFSGIVTVQEAKKGQIISPNIPVVSLISPKTLKIEAFVPEISVGKIALQNLVRVVFEALPEESFDGTVIAVDPAEKIIDGVVNFKVTIALRNIPAEDSRLKSGLTANLSIITASKVNVLGIPRYAIHERDKEFFVNLLQRAALVEVPVSIGLRGTDGVWEVVSGLKDGDQILISSEKVTKP